MTLLNREFSFYKQIKVFLHQEMCYRSSMFENQKFHNEPLGYTPRKKNMVILDAEKRVPLSWRSQCQVKIS